MDNRNEHKVLKDFMIFALEHPELRFWQALSAWSEHNFILTAESIDNETGEYLGVKDTFNWYNKNQ